MVSRLKDTLLLVGGDADRLALREIFKDSYNLLEAENIPQAALLLKQNDDCIAAVLLDLAQIGGKDADLINQAAHHGSDAEIPVLALVHFTGDGTQEELAFSRGASDVIHKPYTPVAIRRRVQLLIDLYMHKWSLQTLVREQRQTIRNTNQVVLDALSAIIEHRSTESGNHVLRIRRFTKILLLDVAQNCPEYGLTRETIDIIASAAALHDIGKVSIPDAILNKPGKLTPAEFETIKTHTSVGSELILHLNDMGDTEYLRYAYNIALYHHERWDGNGYPCGLAGDEIPICAQVVGIADVFDALTTPRVYKPAFPFEQAINMILNGECGTFSPKLLECFKNARTQFIELALQYADGYSPKNDAITLPLPGPVRKQSALDTLELSQIKYQALLHYIDNAVLQVDLIHDLYHLVYNPYPELEHLLPSASFRDIVRKLLDSNTHPEDRPTVEALYRFVTEDFIHLNLRRRAFSFRMFNPITQQYQPSELVFLRLHTGDEAQHIATVIWRKQSEVPLCQAAPDALHTSPALFGLCSTALRCCNDRELTIDAGAQDLFPLTGFNHREITETFAGKLLQLVLPQDRPVLLSALETQIVQGGAAEAEFRILHKSGESVWVLAKSRLHLEENGQEYFYFAMQDNSRAKAVEQDLQARIERNQTIIDQSDGIVFEWSMDTDTMYCSPKWKEHFGYNPVSKNYGKQMGIATHFHPDDLPTIRNAIEEIKASRGTVCIDVRIADADAKYLWTRITATAYLNEQGQLSRIIGLLQDIEALKQAEFTLRERAEKDSLTKLFNKESSQTLISEYLAERDPHALAAMLVLDLDNFKAINDRYGHLYGDSVLSQIGSTLKQLFRSNDVIGRIGGDEFIIFLQDIPSEELTFNRCELILTTFRTLLEQLAPGLNVSCSIGVAMVPSHGTGFNDLFRRADEALYLSKSQGKNTYTLYDPQKAANMLLDGARVPTRIDSETQPGLADASFVQFVFRRLYESNDIIKTFNELLAHVGEQLNVSRVYIFENNENNTACSNTFEWCNEGISPEIDNLQNISYISDIAGWPDVFNEQGLFYCTDITSLAPHFRAILEPQGIKSMLQCAIMDNGVFRGYVGFDECSIHRLWTQDQINLLQFLSEALAIFLIKKRIQDKVAEQAADFRGLLDRQDIWLYVIDPETCELKFINEKVRSSISGSTKLPCYKAFRNHDKRCEDCPAVDILQVQKASAVINDSCFGTRVRASASRIRWNGEPACLLFCHELEG